jgi:predicted acylesterase/phospholipase RssA
MSDTRPDFAEVCAAERKEIEARRRALKVPAEAGLVGLALSGGGIRSATFSLGVLQALSANGLLRLADYLSTVSGGGFIGGCVSALLNDPHVNADEAFPLRARAGAPDTPAVLHVRNSENYLAPGGFADRMRIPALLLRGIVLNLMFLCPYLLLAVSLTEALMYWDAETTREYVVLGWVAAGCAAVAVASLFMRRNIAVFISMLGLTATSGGFAVARYLDADISLFTVLPGAAPLVFLLLVITYPLVSRRVARGGWDTRNAYEASVSFWFVATVVSILLWPFFRLVGAAVAMTPADLLAIVLRFVDLTTSLTTLAIVLALAVACVLVPKVASLARRVVMLVAAASPLAIVAAYLVLCVLLINPPGSGLPSQGWVVFGVAVAWFAFNLLVVNVNLTSAHGFYRDRLSRAYCLEGQKLSGLNQEGSTAPYHLLNVALDLNGTTDVNVRGRNSDFFFFSKHFTGGQRTGYCRTHELERADPHVNLGTAVAISGAAASPNAGVTTVKQLTALMSLLNVRLDYWLPNPAFVTDGMRGFFARLRHRLGPGPSYLWREALGQVDSRGQFVNISDGGHIENLAIYELLRRRCRLIIAVDGEQDGDMYFDGLLKLVLYARIDLGITIDADLSRLRLNPSRLSETHCIAARIDYGGGEDGMLLYLKASMTGDEDEAMRDYRRTHPQFPHEPTSDQFFDERQFEMYRALGVHVGEYAVAQLTGSLTTEEFARIRDFLTLELAWGRPTYA